MSEAAAVWIVDPYVQVGLIAVFGSVATRIALRGHPTLRFVGQLAFFVVLTVMLITLGIVPFKPGPTGLSTHRQVFVGISKIVWWTSAAWSIVSFVRAFLIWEGSPREGRLVQDLLVALIYVGTVLSIVAYVFDAPVGTLIATSGVFAVILGLALQSTLGDVFSGIALNLGRPYAIGDWIVLNDQIEGRVVETNWRSTHLVNGANDLVVVPNSDLAKARITNRSSPEPSHGLKLVVAVAPTVAPAAVVEVMERVLASGNSILFEPPPTVQVKAMNAAAIEIELAFRVADIGKAIAAQNEMFDLAYRHSVAAGLTLASPGTLAAASTRPLSATEPLPKRSTPLRLLDELPMFAALTEDEKQTLAGRMVRRTYRKGEIVARPDDAGQVLHIVRGGVVLAVHREADRDIELDRLAPGDFFGGGKEAATFTAATFAVTYGIDREVLEALVRDRSAVAEALAAAASRRTEALKRLSAAGTRSDAADNAPIVERIRHLFQFGNG